MRLRAWQQRWRNARRRVVWAVAILIVASVPLVIFALAGLPHIFRNALVRNLIAHQAGELPAVSDPAFAQTLTLLTGAKLAAGSAVEVLTNGEGTFAPLWNDLASARRARWPSAHAPA
jgi:hypothetical protein